MAVLCGGCITRMGIATRPPVRVRDSDCQSCGGRDHPKLKNYDIADELVHGSARDPNALAEREEATGR